MNTKRSKRTYQPRVGQRRTRLNITMEPALYYRITGLAQARGVSVSSLIAAGARNELSKASEGQDAGAR
ncbi:MAG: hypothetical protein M5U05_19615 [Anaerolineales bacterium]|nr:hypothetical protein [Anaerolineales bacterium]